MSSEVSLRLELVAAKAKQLAEDQKNGRLWPGELSRGMREIQEQLNRTQQDSRDYDRNDR